MTPKQTDYTPSKVWALLNGDVPDDELDHDEMIDLQIGLSRLPAPQQIFLVSLAHGYSAVAAMKAAGKRGNSTRYTSRALMALTEKMNNGDGEKEHAA